MDVTLALARFLADSRIEDIDEPVQDEAVRALVNWLGCAIGGSLDPLLDNALDAFARTRGAAQATLIGRGDRIDCLSAALLGGMTSSVLDYDDLHIGSRIRPSVVVASALMPLAEYRCVPGRAIVHAFLLGSELACRAGLALGIGHGERGWDSSATCGVLGAAAACAKLLGLDEDRTCMTLGIAATLASGVDEGALAGSQYLNLGCAARNGLSAALLASEGFTSSSRPFEAPRGLLNVLGEGPNPAAFTQGLGDRWEFCGVVHKRYACAAPLTPVVDACLALKARYGLRSRSISAVEIRVHPSALELGAMSDAASAASARRSVHACAAAALVDGRLSAQQFDDVTRRGAQIAKLASHIDVLADAEIAPRAAMVTVHLHGGRSMEQRLSPALSSLGRPMNDAELSDKFRELAADVLATSQTERMLALAWNIRALGDVGALIRASVPEEEFSPDALPGSPLLPR
jgi:2-methylcitrate dehydratase PrpD